MSSAPAQDKVALVTGANGVTGAYVVAQLACEPHWSRIIATSRRPPYRIPKDPRVEFAQCDLAADADTISHSLKVAGATGITHFFHMAYVHHDTFEKQYEYNVPFFRNILTAVNDVNMDTLERVVLQTGAKHYGFASKAPPKEPITEDMGRLGLGGPPNFYYPQEDFMFALQRGKKWTWNVTRPFMINGFTFGSGQSYACTAALYFTMQKYLGEKAIFPLPAGDDNCYNKRQDVSSATNIAAFTTYMACHPKAANQDYNIVDNDANAVTWRDLWEYMGEYFGVPVTAEKGFDLNADLEAKFKRGVWSEIAARHGGDKDACEKFGTWYFFHFAMLYATWGAHVSMEKAKREIGWTTQCDSREELKKIFDLMKREGVIPCKI